MLNDLTSSISDTTVPAPDTEGMNSQQPMAFQGKIDFGILYHQLFLGIQRLHGTNQDERARELFYDSIGHFACLWDADFVRGFVDVQECFEGDMVSQYRLHVPEFSRLMQRAGIAPKPDVKLIIRPDWVVPETLHSMDSEPDDPHDDECEDPYDESNPYENMGDE